MTTAQLLSNFTEKLKSAGIPSARLDTLLLMEHVLKKTRAELLANENQVLDESTISTLTNLLKRRINREPLAYITGQKEFYGHNFIVSKDVLIPRPESEAFLELSKDIALPENAVVLDVGTGSGCIGISYALEHPNTIVYLSDISNKALSIANKNATRLGANNTRIISSNLLENLPSYTDIVFANLPYVPTSLTLEPELSFEPGLALYSNNEGLEHYERLFEELKNLSQKPRHVLTESHQNQQKEIQKMASAAGYALAKISDLVQLFIYN